MDDRSENNLAGVDPRLVAVVRKAAELSRYPFVVTDGLRSLSQQKMLVARGVSKTLKSLHLTGQAVDIAVIIDGKARWEWHLYEAVNAAFELASEILDTPIVWGGSWRSFKDGCHFELSRNP